MSATLAGPPRRPPLARNTLPSFVAALLMHALLIAGMWFAVQWRTSSDAPAVAELWAPLPPVEPTPVVQPPAPVPPPEPAPPQPEAAKPEADIVLKQRVKPHAPEQQSPPPVERRPVEKREPKKAEKKPEPKPTAQEIERERRLAEKLRQSEIARLTGEASASSSAPATGTARSAYASPGVISNAYSALIKACVRSHLAFAVPPGVSDQVYARFKVELLPTGEQASLPQLVKPSGLPGYDDAAERAIIQCDPFPRDQDGTIPSRSFTLDMYPIETR
jgi:colicin import membrane protein